MILFKNISQILSLAPALTKDGRNLLPEDLGVLHNCSLVFDHEKIHWIGQLPELPDHFKILEVYDLTDHVLTPELVDSHTHLVFAGNRADEYVMRLNGVDYQEIANTGGGIIATTKATRGASFEELFQTAVQRINDIYSYGVGTIEIKTGYSLTLEGEYLASQVIDALKKHFAPRVQVIRTTMAAHALPPEYSDTKSYLKEVVFPLMEKLVKDNLVDQADIFHEKGYFTDDDLLSFIQHCQSLNLPFKLHADEFHDNGGAVTAAKYEALSADHLLSCKKESLQTLAQSKTVATLLPGTGFFLGKQQADAQALLQAGAKVAMASDFNPGSCHMDNLLFCASLAAPYYKMNIAQLWAAITLNSAHALGLKDQGALVVGKRPRFALFACPQASEITYSWGKNLSIQLPHLNV